MCQQIVPHAERYLSLEEIDGAEVDEGGETADYCMECAQKKGYAIYKTEKHDRILTVFPQSEISFQ
jgi:hypothetical protein